MTAFISYYVITTSVLNPQLKHKEFDVGYMFYYFYDQRKMTLEDLIKDMLIAARDVRKLDKL